MKGPYERLKYDLRRLWKCPACNRADRTSGSATSNWCTCKVKSDEGIPVPMVMVEDGVRRILSQPNSTSDPPAPDAAAPDSSKSGHSAPADQATSNDAP